MIYGLVKTYQHQNKHEHDYIEILSLLHKRMVERGWDGTFVKGLIIWADAEVRQRSLTPTDEDDDDDADPPSSNIGALKQDFSPRTRVFFHLEYHPSDIPKSLIRDIYNRRCKSAFAAIGIDTLTIAYSRPPTLQQALTRAHLHEAPGRSARRFFENI